MSTQSPDDWFKELYQREERGLYNVALRFVGDSARAMDLVQDAFLGLWQHRIKVKNEQAKAYLYQSVLNMGKNALRFKKFKKFVGLEIISDNLNFSSRQNQDIQQSYRDLCSTLAKLPEHSREVLLLSEFSGFNTKEIAEMLKIPEGTVASRKNKALGLVRQLTAQEES